MSLYRDQNLPIQALPYLHYQLTQLLQIQVTLKLLGMAHSLLHLKIQLNKTSMYHSLLFESSDYF